MVVRRTIHKAAQVLKIADNVPYPLSLPTDYRLPTTNHFNPCRRMKKIRSGRMYLK